MTPPTSSNPLTKKSTSSTLLESSKSSTVSSSTGSSGENLTPTSINTPSSSSSSSTITILGFGSLLSKTSAQTTFPNLQNFRSGKVYNYKRVFAHPASIFFQRNIVNYETLEFSSLSVEPCCFDDDDDDDEGRSSFICSVFEVSNENGEFMQCVSSGDGDSGTATNSSTNQELVASMAFREREEEFDIIMVPYEELTTQKNDGENENDNHNNNNNEKIGVLCCRSTDEKYIQQWGKERFEEHYKKYNIDTIWNWKEDSGLRPCGPYLRHCVLAAKKMGDLCYNSFLDETYLVDRKTTIRSYLEKYPEVMDTLPPVELQSRYGG